MSFKATKLGGPVIMPQCVVPFKATKLGGPVIMPQCVVPLL